MDLSPFLSPYITCSYLILIALEPYYHWELNPHGPELSIKQAYTRLQ